ncbi:MAG: hypothetical protein M3008_11560, partial [Chloroflexota bacterium]|nr:hypothetical protein [Chloroflexota bacterium]
MKVYVPLTIDEQRRLLELAKRERRRPQDQAAILIAQGLGVVDGEEKGAITFAHDAATKVRSDGA